LALSTNKNNKLIDLPSSSFQILSTPNYHTASTTAIPTISAAKVLVNDLRGTGQYIYYIDYSTTRLYRYDTWADQWQDIASLSATNSFMSAVLDPVNNRLWVLCGTPAWGYYDLASPTFAYTSRSTTTMSGSAWTVSVNPLVFCPNAYNGGAGGNDDYIYAKPGNGNAFYRYSISGNSWTAMTAPGNAGSYGDSLVWLPGYNTDYIYRPRGNAANTWDRYSISGNTWSAGITAPTNVGSLWSPYFGTTHVPRGVSATKSIVNLSAQARLYQYDPSANTLDMIGHAQHLGLFYAGSDNLGGTAYVKDGVTGLGLEFVYCLGIYTAGSVIVFCRMPLIYQ
jgi:hypothetical protein